MADLVSKSGTKSVVWQYFGLRKGTDGVAIDDGTAVCCSCRKIVSAKHGNMSYLLAHLRIHHSNLHAEVTAIMKGGKQRVEPGKRQNQQTLAQVVEVAQSYERTGKKMERIDRVGCFF